jgi:hypothetical protein
MCAASSAGRVLSAVPELRSSEDADHYSLSNILYDSGLDLLPIPDEFPDPTQDHPDKVGFS